MTGAWLVEISYGGGSHHYLQRATLAQAEAAMARERERPDVVRVRLVEWESWCSCDGTRECEEHRGVSLVPAIDPAEVLAQAQAWEDHYQATKGSGR